ncbi:restriction endonuclease subunit S [Olleya aquimaris]|uniref:Type I restriction enzyme S subunit/type I restriction enzyme M protein n=1 Tax=Olleya aquimaris TaxID=639310 RepID=A0A327RA21_9FLAO|nr:restriction endonuclease subunit S [Olleya aquimaris]RAJ12965.1 type I restriction enzyme S subunit/type I restriction enzyme M protein [Olleya aquimaris]
MLEGLEISVLNLSEVLFDNTNKRIDSEYYKKEFINFFKNVPNLNPLGSFVKEGYRVVYENTKTIDKIEAIEGNHPYFLQATDLDTPFIKTDNLYYVHNDEWERYPKGRIKKGEILIEVKGKIDKVSIVPGDFPEKTLVTGSLFKLSVNEKINKHVLLTYLISKYGKAFKDRFKTNLLISYVSKPDLYRIPIPSFSNEFQLKIDEIFETIFSSKNAFKEAYKEAENILLEEIDLQNLTPSKEPVNVKSFKDSFATSGRLDAEYYQLKYEKVVDKVKSKNFDTLNNLVDIKKSIEPGSKNYVENGLPFMRVADLSKNGLSEPQKYISEYFVKENQDKIKKLKPKKGTILFSKDGSVGIAYHLRQNYNGITSGAILHLNVKDETRILPEYLTLALNSKVVQMQAERDAGGSIILHWRVGEIENVVVPIIDFDKQREIADLIEQSFSLKKQSEHLLEVAKKAVEIAIEENEENALAYIKTKQNVKSST